MSLMKVKQNIWVSYKIKSFQYLYTQITIYFIERIDIKIKYYWKPLKHRILYLNS